VGGDWTDRSKNNSPGRTEAKHQMTVKWERFAGDTDVFAVRLAFMPDPDDSSFADPDDAASWGSFQLWVNGQNLCSHVDQGEVLQSTHWYLLSLLEWLANSWNALLHEERLPNLQALDTGVAALAATHTAPALAGEADTITWDEDRFEWRSRHAIRSARVGGLFPNVVIRRLRDLVEISWDDEPIPGESPGFRYNASAGMALINPTQVAEPLFEILSTAVSYLANTDTTSYRISNLLSSVANLRADAQHETRLSWLAGLREIPPMLGRLHDSISETEMQNRWSEIVSSLREIGGEDAAAAALEVDESPLVIAGSCQAALLFSSVSPTVTYADVRTLASVLVDQYINTTQTFPINDLAENLPLLATAPAWEQGYELAEAVHARLGLDFSQGWVDIAKVLGQLGVTTLSRKIEDHRIRACCLVGPHHTPTVIHNEKTFFQSESAQRFSAAHELCHLLFDRSHGRRVSIASGPWAPRGIERRANAFAAMFLMPTELLQETVADAADPIGDLSAVTLVANGMRVSRRAVIEHLYNTTLMSEADRDDLLRQIKE